MALTKSVILQKYFSMSTYKLFFLYILLILTGCNLTTKESLPILGRHEYIELGDGGIDTVFHSIKSFSFMDQDSSIITNASFAGQLYVADFFFTSCPSICPIMKVQLLRVYEKYQDNDKVAILSHTIDPDYDKVPILHDYAQRLEVESDKWHFVTGDKDQIYDMAQTSYYVATRENDQAPGGYEHSGAFILIDPNKHIRGVYDGTDAKSIDKLLRDIDILLEELNEN